MDRNKVRRKYLILMSSVVVLTLFAQSAYAYVSYKLLSVPRYMQEQSLWCWAAATEMIADYFGANTTQSDIVKYVKGSVVNEMGNVTDMQNALSKYQINSAPNNSIISFQSLVNFIESNPSVTPPGKPMAASVSLKPQGTGHMHVIYGYYQNTDTSEQNVYYVNPATGTGKISDYTEYKNNDDFTWTNTLQNIFKY